jgi:hypothetical protein
MSPVWNETADQRLDSDESTAEENHEQRIQEF